MLSTILSTIEKFLAEFPNVIAAIVGLTGWVWGTFQYLAKKKMYLSIDSKDNKIICYNNSEFPIEITHCTVAIYDMAIQEQYAEKKQFLISSSGIVKAGEGKDIITLDNNLVTAIEELFKPKLDAMKQYDPSWDCARSANIDIYLTCKRHDRDKLKLFKFKRMIGGHPSYGYGISYRPYHFENRKLRKLKIRWGELKGFIRDPENAIQQYRRRKEFQTYLNVCGIIQGLESKKIDEKKATQLLQNELGTKNEKILAEKLKNIIERNKPVYDIPKNKK